VCEIRGIFEATTDAAMPDNIERTGLDPGLFVKERRGWKFWPRSSLDHISGRGGNDARDSAPIVGQDAYSDSVPIPVFGGGFPKSVWACDFHLSMTDQICT